MKLSATREILPPYDEDLYAVGQSIQCRNACHNAEAITQNFAYLPYYYLVLYVVIWSERLGIARRHLADGTRDAKGGFR